MKIAQLLHFRHPPPPPGQQMYWTSCHHIHQAILKSLGGQKAYYEYQNCSLEGIHNQHASLDLDRELEPRL